MLIIDSGGLVKLWKCTQANDHHLLESVAFSSEVHQMIWLSEDLKIGLIMQHFWLGKKAVYKAE